MKEATTVDREINYSISEKSSRQQDTDGKHQGGAKQSKLEQKKQREEAEMETKIKPSK